jgi:hypothetical protein
MPITGPKMNLVRKTLLIAFMLIGSLCLLAVGCFVSLLLKLFDLVSGRRDREIHAVQPLT